MAEALGGARRSSQASRAATISSCVRPTKFHHMTMSDSNGSPPRRNSVESRSARTSIRSRRMPRYSRL
jgi:hypothetical protein